MRDIRVRIGMALYRPLDSHLLRQNGPQEQAAFLFCRCEASVTEALFTCFDAMLIQHEQYAIHSAFHLELDDAARAQVIKMAHDQHCSLVEIHSHTGGPACFSASDFIGLSEFVPHVWWRLRHRPYGALVVTSQGIDGLAWLESPEQPERVNAVDTGRRILHTTGLSFRDVGSMSQ